MAVSLHVLGRLSDGYNWEPTKTAHRQNGPMKVENGPLKQNGPNGRKNMTKTPHSHVQNGPLRNIVQISDN